MNTHSSGPVTRDTVSRLLALIHFLDHLQSQCGNLSVVFTCVLMHCLSSDVIRALGGSRAAMLVLQERSDCGSVVAHL